MSLHTKLPFNLINGVTLFHVDEFVLKQMHSNKNFVILISKQTEPNKPIAYQRACDYINFITLKQAGLVETSMPYDLSSFPLVQQYYLQRDADRALDRIEHILHEEGTEEHDEIIGNTGEEECHY